MAKTCLGDCKYLQNNCRDLFVLFLFEFFIFPLLPSSHHSLFGLPLSACQTLVFVAANLARTVEFATRWATEPSHARVLLVGRKKTCEEGKHFHNYIFWSSYLSSCMMLHPCLSSFVSEKADALIVWLVLLPGQKN